jgi:hypothetical protein
MTYDEFQASEEKPDKKAKTKAGSKRKRSPSPVEKKVKPVREQKIPLFQRCGSLKFRYGSGSGCGSADPYL